MALRFQFKLQRLLEFRTLRENQVRDQFALATKQFLIEKERLNQFRETLNENIVAMRNLQEEASSLGLLKIFQEYIDTVRERISRQTHTVQVAANYRAECQKLFEEASKKRKAVDNLKEKRLIQYQEMVLQDEQKYLDELATQIFIRRS